jgi:threonine synthase
MIETTPIFVCHGCAATVDMARDLPFACANAGGENDDTDHVLVPAHGSGGFITGTEADPFLRYRALLSPYRLGRSVGLPDDAWTEIVGTLESRLIAVDGRAFRVTPMSPHPALAKVLAMNSSLWVKDETGNVAGSHKARHLMGVMLYLRILEAGKLPGAEALRARRLAIASCGNAALAAAVVARASEWPLDAYIPPDANISVVKRLKELGTTINVCDRRPGETGDPCMRGFRHAVRDGAIPFSVQGPENGLAIEGGRTLAFEMAEAFSAAGDTPAALFVQVGGGALASALWQGFAIAAKVGALPHVPRLMMVQTAGCAPFARCWQQLSGVALTDAVRHRSRFMWPWAGTPASAATGILDDETYDWWEAAKGVRETGGDALVVDENAIMRAYKLSKIHTGISVSTTGTAGLAGLIKTVARSESAAVVFSGSDL